MLEARPGRDGGAPDAAGADRPHEPMCIARDAVTSTTTPAPRLRPIIQSGRRTRPSQRRVPRARAHTRALPRAPSAGPSGLQAAGRRSRRPGPVVDAAPPCPKGRGAGGREGPLRSAPSRAPLPPGDSLWSERSERQGGAGGGGSRGEGAAGGAAAKACWPEGPASDSKRDARTKVRALAFIETRAPSGGLRPIVAEWRGRCVGARTSSRPFPSRPPRERRCTGRDTDARALPSLLGSARASRRHHRGSRGCDESRQPEGRPADATCDLRVPLNTLALLAVPPQPLERLARPARRQRRRRRRRFVVRALAASLLSELRRRVRRRVHLLQLPDRHLRVDLRRRSAPRAPASPGCTGCPRRSRASASPPCAGRVARSLLLDAGHPLVRPRHRRRVALTEGRRRSA